MIHLDYRLDEAECQELDGAELATATETDFDYYLFPGDIRFRVGEADFSAEWGWVPVLHFASNLYLLARDLKDKHQSDLEFTESEETITFRRRGDQVHLTASYTDAKAEVALSVLQTAATDFLRRLTGELAQQWPELSINTPFCRMCAWVEPEEEAQGD